eukprot:TRINITY_DN1523_c0_g1_i2.p1 TRINITY_DN1523_c0_g1~~TRINITY_DN1523_c0_g1_i2.p1  ORF type:complete len:147 (+),score=25.86 TRINITY_DN1523_c0_g1_i2:89-529(+)
MSAIYCPVCSKRFDHPSGNQKHIRNMLDQHMQVHKPRNVSCPVCKETRFRSAINAVQHVESGACSGCRGKENAREQIYNFIGSNQESRDLLSHAPALDYDGRCGGQVPSLPYQCKSCGRKYAQVSSLMQHKEYTSCGARKQPSIGW